MTNTNGNGESALSHLVADLKTARRHLVVRLTANAPTTETVSELASLQSAITAVEQVQAEFAAVADELVVVAA